MTKPRFDLPHSSHNNSYRVEYDQDKNVFSYGTFAQERRAAFRSDCRRRGPSGGSAAWRRPFRRNRRRRRGVARGRRSRWHGHGPGGARAGGTSGELAAHEGGLPRAARQTKAAFREPAAHGRAGLRGNWRHTKEGGLQGAAARARRHFGDRRRRGRGRHSKTRGASGGRWRGRGWAEGVVAGRRWPSGGNGGREGSLQDEIARRKAVLRRSRQRGCGRVGRGAGGRRGRRGDRAGGGCIRSAVEYAGKSPW